MRHEYVLIKQNELVLKKTFIKGIEYDNDYIVIYVDGIYKGNTKILIHHHDISEEFKGYLFSLGIDIKKQSIESYDVISSFVVFLIILFIYYNANKIYKFYI